MNSPKIFFLFSFFLLGFFSAKAQVQVSDQKNSSGISSNDTITDHSVPRLSTEKMSAVSKNNTSDNTSSEKSDGRNDSVPGLNTNKIIPVENKPKN